MILSSKKLFIIFVIFASFLVFGNVSKADERKTAVIDIKRIENNTQISKDFLKKMSLKENEIKQQLLMRKQAIDEEVRKLDNKRSILTADDLQKQIKELDIKYQQLQMDGDFYSKIFELARVNSLVVIQDNIKKATNIVVKNNKNRYDMVITADTAIYIDDSKFDDITDETIKTMDKISKTINYEDAYKRAESEAEKMFKNAK